MRVALQSSGNDNRKALMGVAALGRRDRDVAYMMSHTTSLAEGDGIEAGKVAAWVQRDGSVGSYMEQPGRLGANIEPGTTVDFA